MTNRAAPQGPPGLSMSGVAASTHAWVLLPFRGGQASLDLHLRGVGLELSELGVQRGGGQFHLALGEGLLLAHAVLEAAELARGVQDVDRAEGLRDLSLSLGGLLARDQLVAAGLELGELVLHLSEAGLQALRDIALRSESGLLGLDLVLELDLLAEGNLRPGCPTCRLRPRRRRCAGQSAFAEARRPSGPSHASGR